MNFRRAFNIRDLHVREMTGFVHLLDDFFGKTAELIPVWAAHTETHAVVTASAEDSTAAARNKGFGIFDCFKFFAQPISHLILAQRALLAVLESDKNKSRVAFTAG